MGIFKRDENENYWETKKVINSSRNSHFFTLRKLNLTSLLWLNGRFFFNFKLCWKLFGLFEEFTIMTKTFRSFQIRDCHMKFNIHLRSSVFNTFVFRNVIDFSFFQSFFVFSKGPSECRLSGYIRRSVMLYMLNIWVFNLSDTTVLIPWITRFLRRMNVVNLLKMLSISPQSHKIFTEP